MRWILKHRRLFTFAAGALMFSAGVYALFAAEPAEDGDAKSDKPAAEDTAKDDAYAVPETDDPAKLLEFIEKVRAERPPRPRGPAEYRAFVKYERNAPAAIAKAAEKVLDVTKGDAKKKDDYADASAYLLETKVTGFAKADDAERKKILASVKEHLKKYGVRRDEAGVAYGISQAMEQVDQKLAAQTYADFGKLIAKSEDQEIRDLAKLFNGPARRLGLLGSKMEIFGKTLDGKEFDWASYRGKVVLVDFWATWCGPCLAELPNVKEAYEKYHDKGFEVVGVSLDDRRTALDSFLEKNPLPWTQLHEDGGSPMAEHYGINAIPFIALVGKDGKVISTEARGRKLHDQLEEIFGGSESGE